MAGDNTFFLFDGHGGAGLFLPDYFFQENISAYDNIFIFEGSLHNDYYGL
jgi:hypothetical protein